MGREVRRVPANWEHPKDDRGRYVPLLRGSFPERDREWSEGYAQWQAGFYQSFATPDQWVARGSEEGGRYTEWSGPRPSPDDYMPDWPAEQATHFMMYENTSEGTPISPAFSTPEELARWLADTGASAFGNQTASYAAWLRIAHGGWAPSAVSTPGSGLVSGVEALADTPSGVTATDTGRNT